MAKPEGYMIKRSWLLAGLLLSICAGSAIAQTTSVEWIPYGGAYVPTADLSRTNLNDTTFLVRQNASVVFGARLVAWWSRVIGWEGNFAYSTSNAQLSIDGSGDQCAAQGTNCKANVWFASSKLLFRYAPQSYKGWYLFGGLGVALAGHVGDFWERGDATTDLGGVVGIGGVLDITRMFAVRLDVEDYIYAFEAKVEDDPVLGTFVASAETQNDLVFTVGLVISLAGM